jgi:hypothetical protein
MKAPPPRGDSAITLAIAYGHGGHTRRDHSNRGLMQRKKHGEKAYFGEFSLEIISRFVIYC